ncbi:hypothetical protein [Pandoraea anapnoica]|nr:hypothetical protein [Pandoraea anapnoica]
MDRGEGGREFTFDVLKNALKDDCITPVEARLFPHCRKKVVTGHYRGF